MRGEREREKGEGEFEERKKMLVWLDVCVVRAGGGERATKKKVIVCV